MVGKLGLLLYFLQLWQFAMPNNNNTVEVDLKPRQYDSRSFENNFPYQIANKVYHVENKKTNWYQAVHNCRKIGGNLLNIESANEMDSILSLIPEDDYWISANCLSDNRQFISITSGEPMPYYRWRNGEPNNAGGYEFCVEIVGTALNDISCMYEFKYICEAEQLN